MKVEKFNATWLNYHSCSKEYRNLAKKVLNELDNIELSSAMKYFVDTISDVLKYPEDKRVILLNCRDIYEIYNIDKLSEETKQSVSALRIEYLEREKQSRIERQIRKQIKKDLERKKNKEDFKAPKHHLKDLRRREGTLTPHLVTDLFKLVKNTEEAIDFIDEEIESFLGIKSWLILINLAKNRQEASHICDKYDFNGFVGENPEIIEKMFLDQHLKVCKTKQDAFDVFDKYQEEQPNEINIRTIAGLLSWCESVEDLEYELLNFPNVQLNGQILAPLVALFTSFEELDTFISNKHRIEVGTIILNRLEQLCVTIDHKITLLNEYEHTPPLDQKEKKEILLKTTSKENFLQYAKSFNCHLRTVFQDKIIFAHFCSLASTEEANEILKTLNFKMSPYRIELSKASDLDSLFAIIKDLKLESEINTNKDILRCIARQATFSEMETIIQQYDIKLSKKEKTIICSHFPKGDYFMEDIYSLESFILRMKLYNIRYTIDFPIKHFECLMNLDSYKNIIHFIQKHFVNGLTRKQLTILYEQYPDKKDEIISMFDPECLTTNTSVPPVPQ